MHFQQIFRAEAQEAPARINGVLITDRLRELKAMDLGNNATMQRNDLTFERGRELAS